MHPIDDIILSGALPSEAEVAAHPEPQRWGDSYYWDARWRGLEHGAACDLAARHMGAALRSVAKVERQR